MTRRRKFLLALLIPTLLVAAWQWIMPRAPYDQPIDPAACAKIRYVKLSRDHSFHWMHIRLAITDPERHDLSKGLALILEDGRALTPNGLELEGHGEGSPTADGAKLDQVEGMSIRFWLEEKDFSGPIQLRINDGALTVRTGSGLPGLENGAEILKHKSDW